MLGLFILLIVLICLSAFFSGSETGMMSINRYRLRHKVKQDNPSAKRVAELLSRPDRLLGIILIGNTFVNVFASAIATVIAVELFGEIGLAIATFLLTLVILVFAESTPKILAALYPEKVAFPASMVLKILLKIMYPLVWVVNMISNGLLKLFRIPVKAKALDKLTHEELRTLVREAVGGASIEYQEMLLGILDLGRVTVEDIMIPRNEIVGINLEEDWTDIKEKLMKSEHTRVLMYEGTIEKSIGFLHMKKALNLFAKEKLSEKTLRDAIEEPYIIPEATPLNTLLINLRHNKCRIGLVVDEYGDTLGLATLEDILEEIVGEFTTDFTKSEELATPQKDGSFLVDGGVNVRDLNRVMSWELPIEGPKTLSGIIIEHLEAIPAEKICVRIGGYPIEVLEIEGNMIKTLKVMPDLKTEKILEE